MKNPSTLRDNSLWRDTYTVVEYMYGTLDELVANFPDEKWATASKLRNAASDSMFYVAQAVGSATAEANEYDWNNARRNLFSLQTMYLLATKQKFLELEPEIIVKIDAILEQITANFELSRVAAEKKTKEDIEPWLEKYRLWKAMQDQDQ